MVDVSFQNLLRHSVTFWGLAAIYVYFKQKLSLDSITIAKTAIYLATHVLRQLAATNVLTII